MEYIDIRHQLYKNDGSFSPQLPGGGQLMTAKTRKFLAFLLLLTAIFSMTIVNASGAGSTASAAVYGNFRNVKSGKIGWDTLYRSQHPANGSFRSKFANELAEEYRIRTVLNLSDSDSTLKAYFRKNKISSSYYYRTLYSSGRVYTANLSQKHTSSSYRKKVANGLKFLSKNKGPYLIHCEVGRDRTGFVILLLECLMGASYDEMLSDYAISYVNVNQYTQEKARQKAISCLNEEFSYMTGKAKSTNWRQVDLSQHAVNYMIKGGMSYTEISALRKNLSRSDFISSKILPNKQDYKFPESKNPGFELSPDLLVSPTF